MPFLASAAFIREAIESVRAQSYPDWELLLCDDGSTDGSTVIAREYAAADPARIRWLEHEGHATRGASAARNLGLRHARGELIALLDADDVWLPNKLEEQVALLDATPDADVLCGSTEFWYGWTGRAVDGARDHVVRIGVPDGTVVPAPELLRRMLLGRIAVPCTCSIVARAALVQRIGGFEESFQRVFTDQAFYAKLFLDGAVLVKDDTWDRYRQHVASAVASAERAGEVGLVKLRYLHWVRGYLASRGRRDERLLAALDRAIWRAEHPRAAMFAARCRRALRKVRGAIHARVLRGATP